MDDLRAFQDQRYRRYSSGHLRPAENRAQERQCADFDCCSCSKNKGKQKELQSMGLSRSMFQRTSSKFQA